ncbi:hypothetical protein Cgig2_003618 [Carnegiea gigantea]|uniref:Ubiquitin-like protease family profile domain-containing protein n=1 Tax=Carnegiea gigantea TaxID=171969 RepID=A0A9Q1JKU3_9CARY|nr:hypothetical protein Cgig2_003618 [Carnegiea gigantea]
MRKVQVFGTVLEDKGGRLHAKGIVNNKIHLRHVSSDILSLTSVVKENSDTLKMLNANVNRLMKHMVDNETSKSNKHLTDTCTTTYIAHPLKSSEKKEPPMQFENADEIKRRRRIVAEHNFSKNDMRLANELTKSISVDDLNFLHEEDKKVNVNKLRSALEYSIQYANLYHLFDAASNFSIHVEHVARQANGSNDCGMHVIKYMEAESEYDWSLICEDMEVEWLRKIVDLQMSVNNHIKKTNAATENSTVNITIVDTLWDKNADLSKDDSSMDKSLDMFGKLLSRLGGELANKDCDEVEIEPKYIFPQLIVDTLNDEERKCCELCWTLYMHKSSKDEIVYLNQEFGISATVREFISLFPMGHITDSVIDMVAGELILGSRKRHLNRIYSP